MSEALGWVSLYRSIQDKGWYNDSEYVHLWIHLLTSVNHKPNEFLFNGKVEKLQPGQMITGRKKLSDDTGINESKVERILKCFESEQQIKQQTRNKFRLITLVNWNKYQDVKLKSEQQSEQQKNSKRTASEQQVNTNNNVNNAHNKNNENNGGDARANILRILFDYQKKNWKKFYKNEKENADKAVEDYFNKNQITPEKLASNEALRKKYDAWDEQNFNTHLGNSMMAEAEKCFSYYAARNFKISGQTIKDWKAVMSSWMNKRNEFLKGKNPEAVSAKQFIRGGHTNRELAAAMERRYGNGNGSATEKLRNW